MDYKNGKIYQILNIINDEVYVGSTTQPLCKRLYKHKSDTKVRDCNIHKLIREIGEDKFYIELIESYPCNNREELRAREGYYIRERGSLNKAIAGRTRQEWFEDNKEYDKQYHDKNKERIHRRKNERITCNVCGCHITKSNISKHQTTKKCKSYVKPIDVMEQEHIRHRKYEYITCDVCGCQSTRNNLARHQKSNKCKSYVKPIENEE